MKHPHHIQLLVKADAAERSGDMAAASRLREQQLQSLPRPAVGQSLAEQLLQRPAAAAGSADPLEGRLDRLEQRLSMADCPDGGLD